VINLLLAMVAFATMALAAEEKPAAAQQESTVPPSGKCLIEPYPGNRPSGGGFV
jgi:hypothetical protein